MKKYILKYTAFASLGISLLASTGCGKVDDFGNTNVNPNGVAVTITRALLSNSEVAIPAATIQQQGPAYYCQYLGEATYPGISKYAPGTAQVNASGFYSGVLQDLQVIIDRNTNPTTALQAAAYGANSSQVAIATILKSYVYWTITDRWGDIPYSQALQGAANLLPAYDMQEAIYKSLITELTAANELFSASTASADQVQGDLIYSGNVGKWRRFSNTLRKSIALRTSKVYPNAGDYAATEFSKAYNSPYGFITTNADNFTLPYPGGVYPNPYSALNISVDIAVALTFTDALNNMGDTRRQSMVSSPNGVPYGLDAAAPVAGTYARTFNGTYASTTAPLVLYNASISLLDAAEAMERGWIAGKSTIDAQASYEAGITASFQQWGQTMPAGFLTTGPANYLTGVGGGSIGGASVVGSTANTPNKISRVNLQQWISYFPDGIQGWSSWRRTNVPQLKRTIFSIPGTEIPRRLTYGTLDYSSNLDQLNIAIARLSGGDVASARVWWDKP